MEAQFVPGLELAGSFYLTAVRPLLDDAFPGLPHAAALIGPGSEVLGHDAPRSTDHDWGPRVQLLLPDEDAGRYATAVRETLARRLPPRFGGWPTRFAVGVRAPGRDSGPGGDHGGPTSPAGAPEPTHQVLVEGLGAWLVTHLGFDPRCGVDTFDWLATPSQVLAEATGGAVFHDGPGELTAVRARLRWYPDDVWRSLMAATWSRVAAEEHLPGRCAEAGDEAGSRAVTARIVRDVMRLSLLIERRYPPYAKWLGTAFAEIARRVPEGPALAAGVASALSAADWPDREAGLVAATTALARQHNALGITAALDPNPRPFHDRPFLVLDAGRFAGRLLSGIADPCLRRSPPLGGIDQLCDNTTVLCDPRQARALTAGVWPSGPGADSRG